MAAVALEANRTAFGGVRPPLVPNAVKAILESGEDPRRLFSSDESTAAVVEEALRFDPPLHFFDRYALEPAEVAGVKLRKGEKIGLLLGAANRDPERYVNADRFDPSRPRRSARDR